VTTHRGIAIRLATVPFATVDLLSEYLVETVPAGSKLANLALLGASHAIQKYCDQTLFYIENDTVVVDGTGSDTLLLPDLPVTDVSEVLENCDWTTPHALLGSDSGSDSEYDFSDSGLLFRRHGQFVTVESRFAASFGKFPNRRRSVQVTYSHGYSLGGLVSVRVMGAAALVDIDVPGFDALRDDTLVAVYDETSHALRMPTLDIDGDGFTLATSTTGHVLLVTFEVANQMPADIQLIAVACAARTWAQDGANQESVGSYSASYAGQPATLTIDEKKILDRYRDRRR